ncbi:alanine racemase [Lysinibacillus sp. KU-BSD001]|uniref:alanine racemase n=1 Tax=Lysinibacillus sp. KU-BSD001 TaxID=3141328 RepID=UPI0036EECC08
MEQTHYYRPTKAMIDLQAIRDNVQNLRRHLQDHVQIIAVVKANAYGHGDVEVARAALQAGATILAVATPDEAVHIRNHFPETDILVLGAAPVSFAPYASEHRIMLTVFSPKWVKQLKVAPALSKPLLLHMKVDSGMGRIGVTSKAQLLELYEEIQATPNVVVDGVFTHFATADEEETQYFDHQASLFKELIAALPVKPRLVHAANTATALIKDTTLQFDAVRYGISLYGLAPSGYVSHILPFPIHQALSLETELVHVKQLKAGQSVGYGATYTATEDCFIGTLPIGYADGMIRKLGGQTVLVRGERCPIVGRICMDQCMILLPRAYNVGERVTLLGAQENDFISIDEWATKCDTINYEVPCIITSRVPRMYSNK